MPDLYSVSSSLDFQNLIKEDESFLTRNSTQQKEDPEGRIERVTRKLGIVEEIKGLEDCSLSYQVRETSVASVSHNQSSLMVNQKPTKTFIENAKTQNQPKFNLIKDDSESYYNDYFMNRDSKQYQEMRSKQRLRQRTFLMPDDQKKAVKDDKVRIVVNHTCEHCGKLLDCDMIHTRARRFETKN